MHSLRDGSDIFMQRKESHVFNPEKSSMASEQRSEDQIKKLSNREIIINQNNF